MAHRTGMGLGLGFGVNTSIGGSGHEPARFFRSFIDVTDVVLKEQHKVLFDSIVVLERTLANITEVIQADSLVVTEGSIIALRIVGRSLVDNIEVTDVTIELRERSRIQSDNAVVTDNVVVT